jgi:galactose mutarotase-like enzyme
MENIEEIKNGILKVNVKPKGAELCSIQSITEGTEYIWQADPRFWARHSPLLFPIIGRLNRGLCRIDDKEYTIPMHGFVMDSFFDLVNKEPDKLTFQLEDNEQTKKMYPYEFKLTVEYCLAEKRLGVGFQVWNETDTDMFFSIGGHPAFACPIEDGLAFTDYYLQFNKYEVADRWYIENGGIGRNERFLDNINTIRLTNDLFDQDALIFKGLKSNAVTLKSDKGKKAVTVDFPGFTHLCIWSKGKGAPYVCIEPWFGLDDPVGFEGDIKEKEGILSLKPGETFNSVYTITCK